MWKVEALILAIHGLVVHLDRFPHFFLSDCFRRGQEFTYTPTSFFEITSRKFLGRLSLGVRIYLQCTYILCNPTFTFSYHRIITKDHPPT